MSSKRNNIVEAVGQSQPVDTTEPYDAAWVAGKTILVTGGASGFGEGFSRKWAENGANIMVGDVNDARGKALVEELRMKTGNHNHHYIHCDVTNWQSQVDFFREAVKLSPHGGIDSVVANAGISDPIPATFDNPQNLDAEEPPKPSFKCFDVNLVGVMYTAHLAIFYLQKNPESTKSSQSSTPGKSSRDRHLLLIGSIASLAPIPGQIQYAISKHGVLGLFRSYRATSFVQGIRVNMICPYFIDTPLIPVGGRLLLAGAAVGKPEDVVDAGTRLMADTRIVGRALAVGPKVKVDEHGNLLQNDSDGKEIAVWEVCAHDFEEADAFTSRFVRMVNSVERARGWTGWLTDIVRALLYPLRNSQGR